MGFCSSCGWCFLIVAVVMGLGAWLSPLTDPGTFTFDDLPLIPENSHLEGAPRLFKGLIDAPESFAVGSDGMIYTGLHNGDIVKFHPEDFETAPELVVHTGENRDDCGSDELEHICGRPLSLRFDAVGWLYVADAYLGLLRVDVNKKTIEVLATSFDSEPFTFLNGLLIHPTTGIVYFTDSSSHFQRRDVGYEVLYHQPSGKLLSYDPSTKKVSLLVDKISFPNGLILSSTKDSILIPLTSRCSIWKYMLEGETAGTFSLFVDNLPGLPDNLTPSSNKDVLWVGISRKRAQPFSLFHYASPFPWIRRILTGALSKNALMRLVPKNPMVLALNSNTGEILGSLQDNTGTVGGISEVLEQEDKLFLGSFENNFILMIPVPSF